MLLFNGLPFIILSAKSGFEMYNFPKETPSQLPSLIFLSPLSASSPLLLIISPLKKGLKVLETSLIWSLGKIYLSKHFVPSYLSTD